MDVKLYRRSGSKFFWMKWIYQGKLQRESTKTTRKRDAEKVKNKKQETLYRTGGVTEAETLTLNDLFEIVRTSYKIDGLRSLDRVGWSIKNITKHFNTDTKLLLINEREIDEYIKFRLSKGAAPGTINRELSVIKKGFRLLKEKKMIRDSPTIKALKEDNVRQGFLERWDYLNLMKELPVHLHPIIQYIYKTGTRRSEATNIKWQWVDLDQGIVNIPPGFDKKKQGRPIPLDSELLELFQKLYEMNKFDPSEYVFLNGNRTGKIMCFQRSWRTSCINAGLPDLLVHDLRRTAIRNMIRAGVPEQIAMKISGHTTHAVFSRYNIVNLDDVKGAMKKQETYLNGLPKEKPENRNVMGEDEKEAEKILEEGEKEGLSMAEIMMKWKDSIKK